MQTEQLGEWITKHWAEIEILAKTIGSHRVGSGLIPDLIQNAMVRLLQASRARPVENPRAFLQVTLEGLIQDHFRKLRRDSTLGTFLKNKAFEASALERAEDWRLEEVERVLMQFSPQDLQVLSLHVQGATAADISQVAGISSENVRQRVSRLLRKARSILGVPQHA